MGTGRAYVAALAELTTFADADERRRAWRQGMAALAAVTAERHAAPLEGLDPQALLEAVRVALAEGLLADVTFLAPAAAALATFELASGLPSGPERRELGRRVLEQLGTGDGDTFIGLATSLALASRRPLPGALTPARIAVALASPLADGTAADGLALALLGSADLERSWLTEPSTGSLPSRRMAARILERAARDATRRFRIGDDGGLALLRRPSVRDTWVRLLSDRESLVWRHAAVARGLLAEAEPPLAEEITRDLADGGNPTWWRRGAASLAAQLEHDSEVAGRCVALLDGSLLDRDPGVARAVVAGLGGAFVVEPDVADQLAARAVERGGLDGVEALADLRREMGADAPRAVDAAIAWLDRARAADRPRPGEVGDDGHTALLAALAAELTGGSAAVGGSLAAHADEARRTLHAGRIAEAMRAARAAADVVAEAVEFLERLDGDDPVDRRHAFRTLRELDQELLSDGAVIALLSHGDEIARGKSDAVVLAELESRLEAALIARERDTQVGRVAHRGLRLAQLRALVRVIDADAPVDDAGALRERRMRVVRALLPRARLDASPLRRAVWAALTRAFDALLRDEQLELSDLLAGWTTAMDPDDELVVAREASMVPEVRAVLDAYAAAMQATARAADPDDHRAAIAAIAAAGELTGALGATSSPRTDALRASLARLVRALDGVVRARGQRDVPGFLFDELEGACAVLADLVVGARRRLGLPVTAPTSPAAIRGVGLTLERLRRGGEVDLAGDAAVAAVAAGDDQIPLVARLLGVALARLTQLPVEAPPAVATPSEELVAARATLTDHGLPSWLPASRSIGGFHVVRPLGKGAGGSVFVACRAEERHDPAAEQVALKVPDYDGGAARNLSAQEFEAMFREEAGALLSLPRHANLAGFVTFDAGAKPKPILVMELVPGRTLEQVLEVGGLDMRGALRLIDGIAGGLETMHAARVAHLDLKPANVILRGEDTGALAPVLVDFGLAGRRVRPGCGSPHYGAPEVWSGRNGAEPFAADVYAFACLTFEILTGQVLVAGDTLKHVLATHVGGGAALLAQETLGPTPVAELLTAALARRADQRPSIARLRAGINAVAPDMVRTAWPLGA